MTRKIARTVAEANAQDLQIPATIDNWVRFAHEVNGYSIAEELGIDLGKFRKEKWEEYNQTGQWNISLLEARIILFLSARADRHGGGVGAPSKLVNALLVYMSQETGQPYQALRDEEIDRCRRR